MWLRIWEKSEIIFVNDILQFVRLRKNSLSKSNTNYIKKIFYNIQEKYFLDLVEKCNTSEEFTIPKIQGWREYFYGDKNLVRVNWLKVNMNDWDYRMFLAFIISFFPERFLNFFKNLRLRLRFEYILNRNGKYRGIDEKFRKLLLEDEK